MRHFAQICKLVALKALGSYAKFGWGDLKKRIYVKNKTAFKTSIENIVQWNFEKILLTHGQEILSGGHQKLKDAFL